VSATLRFLTGLSVGVWLGLTVVFVAVVLADIAFERVR